MDNDYVQENAAERERLLRLTKELTESDLARPVGRGWTVGTKLLHLAFWDLYCLELLKKWNEVPPSVSTLDVDAVNECVKALSGAVPPSTVCELVQRAARAVDRQVEATSTDLKARIIGAGRERMLKRFIHRRAHLDQIEQALSAKHG